MSRLVSISRPTRCDRARAGVALGTSGGREEQGLMATQLEVLEQVAQGRDDPVHFGQEGFREERDAHDLGLRGAGRTQAAGRWAVSLARKIGSQAGLPAITASWRCNR